MTLRKVATKAKTLPMTEERSHTLTCLLLSSHSVGLNLPVPSRRPLIPKPVVDGS